ncbi:hypothetical protein NQ315_002683 [Exocentrus adspersus]|uniref:RNA-directed DNA polymerase n=1 Tax=Exocentrus adspersus TaxID=1586481 RepID=A0AAV8VIS1_9CUCU|nr:hypothetical protein NQ315_002683 [Exocentrus adspersus]
MRQQVVRAAHDEQGHFGTEKTLQRLCRHYWFPRMKEYVEKYIKCCISCLYTKKPSGAQEGYLHPIEKVAVPFHTVHIDHLGPFPKSRHGKEYLITLVDSFTKYIVLKAVKTTATRFVIVFLLDTFCHYGLPARFICDQGSCFTSKRFKEFCREKNIKLIFNAVATPRANGQNERFNRTILSALLATTPEENQWDEHVSHIQFAINTAVSKATGKTPFELLYGYQPRGEVDPILSQEVEQIPERIEDLTKLRNDVAEKIRKDQKAQKKRVDKKRKAAKVYKQGDLVLIEKQEPATSTSRKLLPKYSGPMVIKEVLPNDRYIVTDMDSTYRTRGKAKYQRTVAVDKMKPWIPTGGLSDSTDSESGEDGVALSSSSTDESEVGMRIKIKRIDLEARSMQDDRL